MASSRPSIVADVVLVGCTEEQVLLSGHLPAEHVHGGVEQVLLEQVPPMVVPAIFAIFIHSHEPSGKVALAPL